MTCLNRELKLEVETNEGLSVPVSLKTKNSSGTVIPLNITNAVFACEIREAPGSTVIGDITVTTVDAAAGSIVLAMNVATVSAIAPGDYQYNLVMQLPNAQPVSLWTAPFTIKQGVTAWP
jgi:hypothetical protein